MPSNENIPFLDLVTPHVELEQELTGVFRRALYTAGFIGGPMVEEFESSFAAFCDTKDSIAISSGTDALRFALMACGVQQGDVVVTVPHTFIATTEAISQAGAVPEFVDIDEQTYNMSVERLREFLEEKCTRDASGNLISRRSHRPVTAIVPVHLYGQMADMDPILSMAEQYGLTVVEDACQAHGAKYFSAKHNRWMTAGSMGRAAAFSFYPGKNLGACGEAGAVTTNDAEIAAKIRMLRDHGQAKKYYHDVEGYNGRLDAIQAGLLKIKLRRLSEWNALRCKHAGEYNRLLSDVDTLICPSEPSWSRAVYHLYVVRTAERDKLIRHLNDARIGTGIHYPVPLHLQKAYRWFGYQRGDFPVTECAAAEIVSLPMFPQLTADQQARVAAEVCVFAAESHCAQPESARDLSEPQTLIV
ncbi:DegT/DnrJ/EryC1/StrS family aminotransferase [Alloacidobacterium dinghuense]|uniref:DegT/DnrJ/EryC1/StrS family aminotransferase n=1 Tax=Alloacidobacterium dinghuense TaxID=2763107 RepID=A0A7G8BLR4_9BACT|nr:DegT/DnrJ/EryC1/StrS family aminotransferase [Alloacidobacterium dinghuense]QNI33484.1 DegT/DnrJ/EryC1/StrS family aminotransferase [Alloacidobacterium dinghuense]